MRRYSVTYTPTNLLTALWSLVRLMAFIALALHLGWSWWLLVLVLVLVEVEVTPAKSHPWDRFWS